TVPDDLWIPEMIDWVSQSEIGLRIGGLPRGVANTGRSNRKRGTLHTVNLLHECRDNVEAQGAILIAASVRDKEQSLPEEWRGDTNRLLDVVMRVILTDKGSPFARNQLLRWHSAMRDALPVNIVRWDSFIRPRKWEDVVHLALIESIVSTTVWIPV